ncbi:6391_t:CDS:1, partial [Funneliformis mosseae]
AYLKSIFKDALVMLDIAFERSNIKSLFEAIMDYCSTKFESKLNKLKEDITKGSQN